jgi:hypothetical protein
MNVQAVTMVAICFASGFLIVHYAWPAAAGWLRERTDGTGGQGEEYYWRVLGVEEGASLEDLTAAHERGILKYDPEKFREFGPEFQDLARERTRHIDNAYARLRQKMTMLTSRS